MDGAECRGEGGGAVAEHGHAFGAGGAEPRGQAGVSGADEDRDGDHQRSVLLQGPDDGRQFGVDGLGAGLVAGAEGVVRAAGYERHVGSEGEGGVELGGPDLVCARSASAVHAFGRDRRR